jgi:hypothetical protein
MVPARSMLLLALAALVAGEKRSPVEIVLARADDVDDSALTWAKELGNGARVTLYSKGRQPSGGLPESLTEVPLPNVGQEPHAYLTHIVKHYDSLAEKTVFMPAATPSQGFTGFHRGAASFLPGVAASDYAAADAAPLFVPTMAVTPDIQQISVRMAFMEGAPEKELPSGSKFTTCSAAGKAGWSPLLPNKFGHTVLEPLMKAQGAKADLKEFWKAHLPGVEMPDMLMYAHGAAQSVSRAQVLSRPKAFYEKLLADVSDHKNPYQAYFVEFLWWYIFHEKEAALCPNDLPLSGPQHERRELLDHETSDPDPSLGHNSASAPHRQLMHGSYAPPIGSSSITVLEPHPGMRLKFGQVVPISWSSSVNAHYKVELWRYGNYETTLAVALAGTSFSWPIMPGTERIMARPGQRQGEPGASNYVAGAHKFQTDPNDVLLKPATGNGWPDTPSESWSRRYLLKPNDKYSIRVCPDVGVPGQGLGSYSERCSMYRGFASSGEFDIVASIDVTSPPTGFSIQTSKKDTTIRLPVHWNSYFTGSSNHTVRIVDAVTGYTVLSQGVKDTGIHDMFLPPDIPSGTYLVEVSADCSTNDCPFLGRNKLSGSLATGKSGAFTIVGNASPPPSPPPVLAPVVAAPFELPIIKAFKDTFGTGNPVDVTDTFGQYSHTTASTTSNGNNCEYVCRVANVMGGRRLLFGGLQFSSGSETVGCTQQQITCNCIGCARG